MFDIAHLASTQEFSKRISRVPYNAFCNQVLREMRATDVVTGCYLTNGIQRMRETEFPQARRNFLRSLCAANSLHCYARAQGCVREIDVQADNVYADSPPGRREFHTAYEARTWGREIDLVERLERVVIGNREDVDTARCRVLQQHRRVE